MAKSAVFLDGDGVLNLEAGYLYNLTDLCLMPGSAAAVRSLNDQGIFCCLVANFSGLAENHYGVDHVEALQTRLSELLRQEADAHLDALYYCPYLSQGAGGVNPEFTQWGTWRKPNTGMLVVAAWDHDLDLRQSFMVGGQGKDVDMAHSAGLRGILVQANKRNRIVKRKEQPHTKPDYVADTLQDGVDWILKQLQESS